MGGAGSGDSAAAAALEDGAVSSVDDVGNDDDDGIKRRINFESGIASMPSPNWYSSTHLTVGLVRDFGASLPRNYHHHHHREEEEVSSSTSKTRGGGKGVLNVIAYCAKNDVVLLDGETSAVLGQISTGHQKRALSVSFVKSWFDFDEEEERGEKKKKNEDDDDDDVFLLVTTSSDDAIRVHDVRAKKCVGKISTLCGTSSSTKNNNAESPTITTTTTTTTTTSATTTSSSSSRYGAKKQPSRCGHGKGAEVRVVEREKRERGSFITGDGSGVMCMWRLGEHTRDGNGTSNNNSSNNNNIAMNIEPEFTFAFAEFMSGITALASMDAYSSSLSSSENAPTFITAVGFESGDVAVHAYKPGGFRERVFGLEEDERFRKSPISSLDWVFVDATDELYLAVGNRNGDLYFCLLSSSDGDMTLERKENLMLLNSVGSSSNSNSSKKSNALTSNSTCWMNFTSIRRQNTFPLMVCSCKGEVTKLAFDVERFIDHGNRPFSACSIVGLKAERATPDFSGHKKLGFSLELFKAAKEEDNDDDSPSFRIVTHGLDRAICFYDVFEESEDGFKYRLKGQISTLGGFIYDIDHHVVPGIGDWTIFACGDGTLRKMENVAPHSKVPHDVTTFDKALKTEILFRADKQRKITSCRFYIDREHVTRCVVVGLDDGTVGMMRVEKEDGDDKLTREEKKMRFFPQKHRGAVMQIEIVPSLEKMNNTINEESVIVTLSETGELWYWRRLPGFFDDKSDAPEPYLDISAAIREGEDDGGERASRLKYKDVTISRFGYTRSASAFVVGYSNGYLSCFENHNAIFKFRWEDTTSHSTDITDIKCDDDGKYVSNTSVAVATSSSDGCVFVRSHAKEYASSEFTGKISHVVPRARQSVTRLEWCKDEKEDTCLACANADGLVRIYTVGDVHSSSEVSLRAVFRGHRGRVRALRNYASHSKTESERGILFSGGDDQTIRIADVNDFRRSPDMGNQCAMYEKEKPSPLPFRQSRSPIARDEEATGNDGEAETEKTGREGVPTVEKAAVKRESRAANSGHTGHVSTTTVPKPSKAQSLFKTEPWESTAKGAEVSESKALELLTLIDDTYRDDKSDANFAYGPEGNALYEKPESTRRMLEIMRVKSRKEEEERKQTQSIVANDQQQRKKTPEFQFPSLRSAEKRAAMAMYADDWNGAAYELFTETNGPVYSDLLPTILSSGGKDLYDICQNEQANRFIDREEYQRAALCFLAMKGSGNNSGLHKAVRCLLDGNLPRDACALATSRLPKAHELCLECYRALATFEEQRGASGAAAKSHIAANKLKNAMRALVRKGQFGCYAAARCAFAMFREDFGVSHSQIIDQGGKTDVSLSSWYCSDDSYEQSIVLNALIDHSLCSTAGGDLRERNLDNGLLFQDLPRPQESINKEYKLLSDEADYLAASLCALENEKDLFPAYPIVQRFWYVECFSTMVKMTLRCLIMEEGEEEYHTLFQYVQTFIETERVRKASSSSETIGDDAKIWGLLFKRVSLFAFSSSSSSGSETDCPSSPLKLLQFAVCFASALARDAKRKMLGEATGASASEAEGSSGVGISGYEFYAHGALNLKDDHRDDAETNALSPSSSSVLSRAVFLASKFGVQENGTLLQFCNSNSSGSR